MQFIQKLQHAWRARNSVLCVGLDPDIARMPWINTKTWAQQNQAIFDFCQKIVDATAAFACAFKPQIAYFSALRAEAALEDICVYIHQTYPELPVILDAKRGDIGSTSAQYAKEAFARYGADAVTINPYLGWDTVQPYLEWKDRGIIVLCRTSNPGGAALQCLQTPQGPLYQYIAHLVANTWNQHGQCGLVMGATFPKELAVVRSIAPDLPLLVPGLGTQGGDIHATVLAGKATNNPGLLLNVSRGILYAKASPDAAQTIAAAAQAARVLSQKMRDAFTQSRIS